MSNQEPMRVVFPFKLNGLRKDRWFPAMNSGVITNVSMFWGILSVALSPAIVAVSMYVKNSSH